MNTQLIFTEKKNRVFELKNPYIRIMIIFYYTYSYHEIDKNINIKSKEVR